MLISVIIPTYNRYDLVNRAIDSVQRQTCTNYEIIVVDDCSADSNYFQFKNRTDIKYFRFSKRSGLASVVRNFGIRQSKGDWIAFLDDDDLWFPEKLSEQVIWTNKYGFICSDAYSNGRLWARDIHLRIWRDKNPGDTRQFSYDLIKNHNLIINSSVLIRKELLERIGLIPEDSSLRNREDYITWLKVLENGSLCYFIDKGLLEYNTQAYKYLQDDYMISGC